MCTDFAAQVGRKALWHPVEEYRTDFRPIHIGPHLKNQCYAWEKPSGDIKL